VEGEAPAEPNAHPQIAQISQIRSHAVSESVQSAKSVDHSGKNRSAGASPSMGTSEFPVDRFPALWLKQTSL
jgi:hypothetical protein